MGLNRDNGLKTYTRRKKSGQQVQEGKPDNNITNLGQMDNEMEERELVEGGSSISGEIQDSEGLEKFGQSSEGRD